MLVIALKHCTLHATTPRHFHNDMLKGIVPVKAGLCILEWKTVVCGEQPRKSKGVQTWMHKHTTTLAVHTLQRQTIVDKGTFLSKQSTVYYTAQLQAKMQLRPLQRHSNVRTKQQQTGHSIVLL